MLLKLYTRLQLLKGDKGEGPVPYIIIVIIIAILAAGIATALSLTADNWLNTVPEPAGP